MSYLSRRATLMLLWLLTIMSGGLLSYLFATPQLVFNRIIAITCVTILILSLIAYHHGYQWPRYVVMIGISLGVGISTLEPYVTQKLTASLLLGPMLALVLAGWPWVIISFIITYTSLLVRAGFTGVYTEALIIGFNVMIVSGMALGRHLTDMTLIRLEEHMHLIEEERTSLADRVEQRTHELSEANNQLRQANRMKDAFLSSITHELRTPMNIILGSVELLSDEVYGPMNDRQQRALGNVQESGRQLLGLINDLLDLAKMQSGHLDIHFDDISVSDVCTQCIRMITPQADTKNIQVQLEIAPNVTMVFSDAPRLRQILLNLLSNAVKFTPTGGTIGLRVNKSDGMVNFSVWDTGIGIADSEHEWLFRPFSQIDSRLARHYEGTGLGLALVAELTELHQGRVSVESNIGKGSCFTVQLPEQRSVNPQKQMV